MASVDFELGPRDLRLAFLEDGPADDLGRCGFFWLGGFMSDMTGSKAEALASLARECRRPGLRFDYSGHGQSGGLFKDGTISVWLDEACHMFTARTSSKRILVGSSMGGWLALLMLRKLWADNPTAAKRVAGLVLIAPAADMTMDLMWDIFTPSARTVLEKSGVYMKPSDYGSAYPITKRLIGDGQQHAILKEPFEVTCPVRILQGSSDRDVPPSHALKLYSVLSGKDVTLTLIKGGDHRLSIPGHLQLIRETALLLAERADGFTR
jgi:pimeloyl-ACP methyl ester carboxylesterase